MRQAIGPLGPLIGSLVVSIVALFIATYGEWLRDIVFRPKLKLLRPTTARPDSALMPRRAQAIVQGVLTQFGPTINAMFYRLRIESTGRMAARNVEVFVEKVERYHGDATEPVSTFLPMNLRWTHREDVYLPRISKRVPKHIDLGHITQPDNRETAREAEALGKALPPEEIAFAVEVHPLPSDNSHMLSPGDYLLTLLLTAENAKAQTERIRLTIRERWNDDPARMVEIRQVT